MNYMNYEKDPKVIKQLQRLNKRLKTGMSWGAFAHLMCLGGRELLGTPNREIPLWPLVGCWTGVGDSTGGIRRLRVTRDSERLGYVERTNDGLFLITAMGRKFVAEHWHEIDEIIGPYILREKLEGNEEEG